MPGGYLGVDVFFVISGYLITLLILKEHKNTHTFSFSNFYSRRIKRLFPAYFLMIFVVLIFSYILLTPKEYIPVLKTSFFGAFSASNIFLAGDGDYFSPEKSLNPLLHTWSLSVEEQFYLLFPLIVWGIYKSRKQNRIFPILALICGLSIVYSLYLFINESHWLHYSTFARSWQLMSGGLLATYKFNKTNECVERSTQNDISILFAISLILFPMLIAPSRLPEFYGSLIVTIGTLIILKNGDKQNWIVEKILSHRLSIFIGAISYSLYLWHQPVISFSKLFILNTATYYSIVIILTSLLGIGSWKFIENPARKYTLSKSKTFLFSAVLIFILAGISFNGLKNTGYPERFNGPGFVVANNNTSQDGLAKSCGFWGKKNIPETGLCEYAGENTDVIAIWGDSHATSLMSGFNSNTNVSTIQMAFQGCAAGLNSRSDNSKNFCIEKRREAFSILEKREDIKTVIVTALWEKTVSETIDEDLILFFEKLRDLNRHVIIVADTPAQDIDVATHHNRMLRLGMDSKPFIKKEIYLNKNKIVNEHLRNISEKYNFDFFDVTNFLCDETICSSYDKKSNLRYLDDDHISYYAAKPIADALINLIKSKKEQIITP
jgi:peptidoglycan/LPS O-acetylase OafA/YrhL